MSELGAHSGATSSGANIAASTKVVIQRFVSMAVA